MARSTFDDVDADGDLAAGMGIAIGAVIALFLVAIALVVIGQDPPRGRAAERAGSRSAALPATLSAESTPNARQ